MSMVYRTLNRLAKFTTLCSGENGSDCNITELTLTAFATVTTFVLPKEPREVQDITGACPTLAQGILKGEVSMYH
jgi:hypothetical protein